MVVKHGRDCPDRCSLCAGAIPRRAEQRGDQIHIDGEPPRPIEPPIGPGLKQHSRRGGRSRALTAAPRRTKR